MAKARNPAVKLQRSAGGCTCGWPVLRTLPAGSPQRKLPVPEDPLQNRLDNLGKALDAERLPSQKASDDSRHAQTTGAAMNLGIRAMTEFVAAVAVGALLGWQLDKWFGTAPVCLVILLAAGTAAGFWNVYKIAAAPAGKRR